MDARVDAAAAALSAGRLDEAEALCLQLLETDPQLADAPHTLGLLAVARGQAEMAVQWFRRTMALAPAKAPVHINLALALRRLARYDEALAAFARGALLAPGSAELHFQWANLLLALGRPVEALVQYDAALAAAPGHAPLLLEPGVALQTLERPAEAAASYGEALALRPGSADVLANLALALLRLDRPDEAVESCDRALALQPGFVDALVNRGVAERERNRLDAAIADLSAAVAAAPDSALPKCNLAVAELLAGHLQAGFRLHEHRWSIEPGRSAARHFEAPLWLGEEDIAGRTVLFHAEQGFGDTIQFCRYAPMAKALGARVILDAPSPLAPLLESLDGVDELVEGGSLPPFDLHCPMMSLPLAFRTTLETIPAPAAHLSAPADRLERWRREIPATSAPKVGVAWFGKGSHKNDRNRSLSLAQLAAAMPDGIELYSLHDRTRPEDAEALAAFPRLRRFDVQLRDFGDTAALAAQMDLVVSVDTSIAHLAGATGRPTWVLLPFAPDWRWLVNRDDSPWYPSVRLFRQPAVGDWNSVLQRLRKALQGL